MLKGLRIEERANGVFLVCDRGDVAHMVAGYADTQKKDARMLLESMQPMNRQIEALKQTYSIMNNILTDSQLDTRTKCGKTIRRYRETVKQILRDCGYEFEDYD